MVHALGTVGLCVGAVAALVFVVAYELSARWRESAEGWHLMTFTAWLGVILTWLSWRTFTSEARPMPFGTDLVRTVIFDGTAVHMLWRCWLLGSRQIWASWRRSKEGS